MAVPVCRVNCRYKVAVKDDLRWHIIDGIVVFNNRILFSDLYSAEAEGTPTPTQVERRKINSSKLLRTHDSSNPLMKHKIILCK